MVAGRDSDSGVLVSTVREEGATIAFLDGGTTQTRLRLWDGQQVLFEAARPIGARTGALDGHGLALRAAVGELIALACAAHPFSAVVACGMLTSPSGLVEVPHLVAPVSADQLARALVRLEIEGCGEILFVPGVRTDGKALENADVMRGEETEVIGLDERRRSGRINFLHFGSHDKMIFTKEGVILGSRTNLNGELLSALTEQTLLKASTSPLSTLMDTDRAWWRQGLEAARRHGLSRAAFLVRVGGLLQGTTPEQGTAWLLGALAEGNLRWVEEAGHTVTTVLYGRAAATAPFAAHLAAQGYPVEAFAEQESALAAVVGAARLYNLWCRTRGQAESPEVRPVRP